MNTPMADYFTSKQMAMSRTKKPAAGWPKGVPRVDPEQLRVPVQIRLPKWLVDWMQTQDKSPTKVIENALRQLIYGGDA